MGTYDHGRGKRGPYFEGWYLKLQTGEGLSLHGTVRYGHFTPLRSDTMGPFRFLPGMECAHGVLSMGHPLEGSVTLNGGTDGLLRRHGVHGD